MSSRKTNAFEVAALVAFVVVGVALGTMECTGSTVDVAQFRHECTALKGVVSASAEASSTAVAEITVYFELAFGPGLLAAFVSYALWWTTHSES